MASEHHYYFQKSSRYFVHGDLSDGKHLLIALHGYGYLPEFFIRKFHGVDTEKYVVVCPEGMHRFYQSGTNGRVGASWMTKEDRLTDIDDYVQFLDSVYDKVVAGKPDARVHLVGFSQGTATACRWASMGNSRIDELTLWAGAFPDDIDYFEKADLFKKLNVKLVIGDEDQYYNQQQIDAHVAQLRSKGIEFELIMFNGDHNIHDKPLLDLI